MRTSRYPELSFTKGQPLLQPSPDWQRPHCQPMGKKWKKDIQKKFWATNFQGSLKDCTPGSTKKKDIPQAIAHLKSLLKLRKILLSFGGEEACLPLYEDDLDLLLKHGEIWLTTGLTMKRGHIGGCHENSAGLWKASRGEIRIATGYYLMDDGMWRSHSWGIKPGARGGRIVETTNKAVLYFGVIRSFQEAEVQMEGYL